jgi:hypothetical protein
MPIQKLDEVERLERLERAERLVVSRPSRGLTI